MAIIMIVTIVIRGVTMAMIVTIVIRGVTMAMIVTIVIRGVTDFSTIILIVTIIGIIVVVISIMSIISSNLTITVTTIKAKIHKPLTMKEYIGANTLVYGPSLHELSGEWFALLYRDSAVG